MHLTSARGKKSHLAPLVVPCLLWQGIQGAGRGNCGEGSRGSRFRIHFWFVFTDLDHHRGLSSDRWFSISMQITPLASSLPCSRQTG